MFHTFQTTTSNSNQAASKNSPKSRRQSSTTHACEECRRRKIRCDGKQPCSHCEWYKHPKLCKYSKKQARVVPSQKLLEELSTSLRQAEHVIAQLIPNTTDLKKLGELSRSELVELILNSSSSAPGSSTSTSPLTSSEYGLTRTKSEDTSAVEALEQEPIQDASWDESKLEPDAVQHIADDVNGLNMSVGRQSSYLGVSSIAAALRVMSKITTALESVVISTPAHTAQPTRSNSPLRVSSETPSSITQPSLAPETMIDAYFAHVNPLIPMIDETRFKQTFYQNERNDQPWLALLNTVYAMGTIAATSAEDNSHIAHFNVAMENLSLGTFGDGHIESLQALGILGGYYLHYENRPNMASGVMGAAMRMACALGLHREYSEEQSDDAHTSQIRKALLIPREVRRRTWWSLFCLDTWAGTTTGRPSLGRISNGVTVQPPISLVSSPASSINMDDEDVSVMILCAEIGFCKIATRVQDRLAEQPLLPLEEVNRFDAELGHWFNSIPAVMRYPNQCPDRARVPRAIMCWWYNNLRILLHRPMLLNNALRSSLERTGETDEEENRVVEMCRSIAGEAIDSIQDQWTPNHMSGWNATWLLFQASMVPLVTLFAEYNRGNWNAIRTAQGQVEQVISQLEKMERWSLTAKRSKDVVSKIYERNRLMLSQARQVLAQQRREQEELQRQRQRQAQQQQQPPPQSQQSGQAQQQNRAGSQGQSPTQARPQPGFSTSQQQQLMEQQFHNGATHAHQSQHRTAPPQQFQSHQIRFPLHQQQHMFPPQLSPGIIPMGSGPSPEAQMGAMFPTAAGNILPSHGGLAGHIGMDGGMGDFGGSVPGAMMANLPGGGGGASFMNEDELNAFWNQIMWGEGEVPFVPMDTDPPQEYEQTQGQAFGYGQP